jgi:hypothetical protein
MAVWRGQRVADFGLALMSRRFLPPGTFEEPESRLPVQAWMKAVLPSGP